MNPNDDWNRFHLAALGTGAGFMAYHAGEISQFLNTIDNPIGHAGLAAVVAAFWRPLKRTILHIAQSAKNMIVEILKIIRRGK